jgi:hypothetical protein
MTARWENHVCALCLAKTGERTAPDESWPFVPLCRSHVIQCGGVEVIDFRAGPALTIIQGGKVA